MGDSTRALCCIVPCYNEEASLPALFDALAEVSPALGRELGLTVGCVLVDDGSRDRTLELLRAQNAVDPNCHYVSFTRNFGKEAGLLAGMAEALRLFPGEDDLFVIMDADLQDPPSLLVDMVRALDEGGDEVDVAATYRKSRAGEPPIRSAFSHLFYRLMNSISDVSMRDGARDFRVMRRRVVQTVVDLPERVRFSKGLLMWGGFRTEWIGYENVERAAGESKWNFWGLMRYAIDGIVAFSVAPLELISVGGLVVFLLSLVFLLFIFVRALLFGDPVAGWPSLVCLITLLSGLQLLGLGVVGLYLSKIYAETKRRPLYVIREER